MHSLDGLEADDLRMTKGGNGTHWEGCEETHWDCKIEQLTRENAELRQLLADANGRRDREILRAAVLGRELAEAKLEVGGHRRHVATVMQREAKVILERDWQEHKSTCPTCSGLKGEK